MLGLQLWRAALPQACFERFPPRESRLRSRGSPELRIGLPNRKRDALRRVVPSVFRPFSELSRPSKHRRNLPHWQVSGATYFVTFRLIDSLPDGVRKEIEIACEAWLSAQGIRHRKQVRLLPDDAQLEFRRLFTAREEQWLDAGRGCCALRGEECRATVVETLRAFDGQRYALDGWVVMPNHVHVLVQPINEWELGTIVASWKKFSARKINALLKRSGSLWQEETFDHVVRDRERLEKFRRYIEENPRKARLAPGEYETGSGSGLL
jgi:REP element-mobilizing transposase RayT